MADTTTELEVLDEIVDVLGGQSGQHKTVVPVLEDIRDLLSGGGGGGGGYNPSLSVGRADALTGADDTAQWAQRVTAGSGAATVRSVQGAAVGWNQYAKLTNRTATSKGITYTAQDGKATFSAPNGAEGQETFYTDINNRFPLVAGHKYIAYGTSPDGNVRLAHASMGVLPYNKVFTGTGTASNQINFSVQSTFTGTYECYPMVYDLTQMFGSGNEPTTVAEFESMYPADYYPYSAPTLKPVRIAGIASTDAQGDELDSIEWPAQTLRAAGSVADMLYSDHVDVRVGVVDMGTLNWVKYDGGGEPPYYFATDVNGIAKNKAFGEASNLFCTRYTSVPSNWEINLQDKRILKGIGDNLIVMLKDSDYTDQTALRASLAGVLLYYELATPTTTPITPALSMTYRVEQGGTESIIVPDGEVSAAPVLTIAEGESAGELVMDALACIATPDGPVATSNHALGTYLAMQGKLWKVTTAIASGEQIVSGTNVTETTVMAELLALAN